MIALTKAIAERSVGIADETKNINITANTILPSVIDTPANRVGTPAEIADKWVKLESIA